MLAEEPALANVRVTHTTRRGTHTEEGPLYLVSVVLQDFEKVKALVEAGASLNNSELGTHPKQLTAWTGEIKSLVWPMTEFKRVLFEPYAGETALELAVRYRQYEATEILSERNCQ